MSNQPKPAAPDENPREGVNPGDPGPPVLDPPKRDPREDLPVPDPPVEGA